MRRHSALAVVLTLAFSRPVSPAAADAKPSPVAAPAQPSWQSFVRSDLGFTVATPQAPEVKRAMMAGVPATSAIVWVDRPKLALVMSVYTFPSPLPNSEADLQRSAARLRQDLHGTITRYETRALLVGLHPAVGVIIESDQGIHVEAKIVHAKNRIYEIQASTTDPQKYRSHIDRFLSSLRLHDML